MRRAILVLVGLAACKKTAPATTAAPDAGPPPPIVAERAADASTATRAAVDAAAEPSDTAPPLPLASDSLELVAVGRTWNSKVISLVALGQRIWLSAVDLDAFADGDGALTKGPDPLKGLPYTPKTHAVQVVGTPPRLYAIRTKNVETRTESPETTVFVVRDGAWAQTKSLGSDRLPHAVVPWGEGALVVRSQIEFNAGPYRDPGPGTWFEYVAPDGSVVNPKLTIDPTFMAWDADSDGTTLSLVGTRGIPSSQINPNQPEPKVGIQVVRGSAKDGFKTMTVVPGVWVTLETYHARIVELGPRALVVPPPTLTLENAWKPTAHTLYLVGDKPQPKSAPVDDGALLGGAAYVDGAVFAIRQGWGANGPSATLVRAGESGRAERVALPSLARAQGGGFRVAQAGETGETAFRCDPDKLVVRRPDDLWVTALCGAGGDAAGIPAVFRRGRKQEPVVLP